METLPVDLENYVLKPLFSFAGAGVIIDVTKEDIDKIEVIKYNPIMHYGGWGIRLGAYNISGNKGLKIYYKKKNYTDSILY